MSEQDEQWFEALAGHRAPASAEDQRLHQALRQAAQAAVSRLPTDTLAEQRLLRRLEGEGLLKPERSQAIPHRRRRTPIRWAQAAVILLSVALVYDMGLQREQPQEPFSSAPLSRSIDDAKRRANQAERMPRSPKASELQLSGPVQESMDAPAPASSPEQESNSAPRAQAPAAAAFADLAKEQRKPARERQSPERVLRVASLSAAQEALQRWMPERAAKPPARRLEDAAVVLHLRCDDADDCQQLARALQALAARPAQDQSGWQPRPDEVLQLRLELQP